MLAYYYDNTDEIPVALFARTSLNSGASRTINWDAQNVTGTATVQHRHLVAFSLELAGAAGNTYTKAGSAVLE